MFLHTEGKSAVNLKAIGGTSWIVALFDGVQPTDPNALGFPSDSMVDILSNCKMFDFVNANQIRFEHTQFLTETSITNIAHKPAGRGKVTPKGFRYNSKYKLAPNMLNGDGRNFHNNFKNTSYVAYGTLAEVGANLPKIGLWVEMEFDVDTEVDMMSRYSPTLAYTTTAKAQYHNGSDWVDIVGATWSQAIQTDDSQYVTFDPITAKRFRILATGNTSSDTTDLRWGSIYCWKQVPPVASVEKFTPTWALLLPVLPNRNSYKFIEKVHAPFFVTSAGGPDKIEDILLNKSDFNEGDILSVINCIIKSSSWEKNV